MESRTEAMTLEQFTILRNQQRAQMTPPRHAKPLSLTKRKTVSEAVTKDIITANGTPRRIIVAPKVTVPVFDTNAFNKICGYVWEYVLGTKGKRISSEGSWRKGIGYIPNMNKGFSDVLTGHDSISFYIETKNRTYNETHKKSQVKFAEWVRSFNGYYISVRTFEDIWDVAQIVKSGELHRLEKYAALRISKTRTPKGGLFDSPQNSIHSPQSS